ncbi:TIGR03013 family XrtA/PEP-CTERM system glycosyltransferase [Thioalkalivibrio sulfidiphilus]|nr:TIGR03013 family XrtA/PEP-CTERM system glycosyltransferase [Thioalkalivibrio sulfidiphilus]
MTQKAEYKAAVPSESGMSGFSGPDRRRAGERGSVQAPEHGGGTVTMLPVAEPARRQKPRGIRLKHSHVQILGRELSTPLVVLAMAEAVIIMAAFYLAVQFRFPQGAAPVVFDGLGLKLVIFAAVNMLAMLSMGLYRRGFRDSTLAVVLRVVGAFALGAAMLAALFYAFPSLLFGRGIMVLAMAGAFAGVIVTRLVGVRLLDLDALKRRVLVLGAGNTATLFNRLRRRSDRRGFELFGFVPQAQEVSLVPQDSLVHLDQPLDQYVRAHQIDDVVIAMDDPRGGFPVDELMACKMNGVNVLDVSDFFEREGGFLKLDILRPSTMIFSRGFRQCLYRDYAKRMLDVATSLVLLALAWPLMLLTALGIWIESRGKGSVLFRQVRVGQNGKPFTLTKFRSMVMDAEGDGVARWAQKQDPRVTRFGNFMRKTRLDELPQLFNVLRGDMSFVGPRPERPEFVEQLAAKLPYYHHRHWVKPGLTGWAQINYPYGASEKDAFEKLQYDLYYVKNQSIALDLLTIIQTVEVVLWGRGSR